MVLMNNARSEVAPSCELHTERGNRHSEYILVLAYCAGCIDALLFAGADVVANAVSQDLPVLVTRWTEEGAVRADSGHKMPQGGSPDPPVLFARPLQSSNCTSLLIPFHLPAGAGGDHAHDSAATSLYQQAIPIPALYQLP